jgi:hypothetical protein
VAWEHVGIGRVKSIVQVQLIDKVKYCQNALSALEALQRARRAGSRKMACVFFAEATAVGFFPGSEPID